MTSEYVCWCINLQSNICPIVTEKSLYSSVNNKIQVELNSRADTIVVGSHVLVVHNHECYIDVMVMIVNLGIKISLLLMLTHR